MSGLSPMRRPVSTVREFLDNVVGGGVVLMAVAFVAIVIAYSPRSAAHFAAFNIQIGPQSVLQWINDALMAVFFLLVGLEIKRELLDGQLSWSRRAFPGFAAPGGMIAPALIYGSINVHSTISPRGWTIRVAARCLNATLPKRGEQGDRWSN